MSFVLTTATQKLLKLRSRLRIVAGGTSAGKTISILQILIDQAQTNPGILISVVSESFPHLRRGAIRDFLNIMEQCGYYNDAEWSKSDFTYSFSNKARIEFFSADMPGKVRGPRRDILFVNEANNIGYEEFDQLRIRTRGAIWIDFNPTNEFWAYTELIPNYEHDFATLTYKDNEGLESSIIRDIESHKHNQNWWKVYGLGQLGELEGKIYRDWNIIEKLPHEAKLVRRGLDFGYSNDPTALVDIWYYNGGYIVDQQIYQKGLSNKQIADYIKNMEEPQTLIVADSAEPKSIDELRMYGLTVIPTTKGAGSVEQGIQYVQDQRISMTKRSVDLIHEYRNYMWRKEDKAISENNREGIINVPEDVFNHCMDAIRYALQSIGRMAGQESGVVTTTPPHRPTSSFIVDPETREAVGLNIDIGKSLRNARDKDLYG